MCHAEVISSQRSPGAGVDQALGEHRVLVGVARAALERDALLGNAQRLQQPRHGGRPPGPPSSAERAEPPVNTRRASGKRRARATASVMRSAASLSPASSRGGLARASSAPPSMMMPVMAPPLARSGRGKPVLERHDQRVAQRRQPADEERRKAADQQPAAEPVPCSCRPAPRPTSRRWRSARRAAPGTTRPWPRRRTSRLCGFRPPLQHPVHGLEADAASTPRPSTGWGRRSRPRNVSNCSKRQRPASSGTTRKPCSPSKMPGNPEMPEPPAAPGPARA